MAFVKGVFLVRVPMTALWRDGLGVWSRHLMAIRIEEHGYLDDSVSGRRTFAAAHRDAQTGMWRVKDPWHRFMCARGERAGQWSSARCP